MSFPIPFFNDSLKAVRVDIVGGNVTLNASDIEIGAVEIKNASTEDRAFVSPSGALKSNIVGINATSTTETEIQTATVPLTFGTGKQGIVAAAIGYAYDGASTTFAIQGRPSSGAIKATLVEFDSGFKVTDTSAIDGLSSGTNLVRTSAFIYGLNESGTFDRVRLIGGGVKIATVNPLLSTVETNGTTRVTIATPSTGKKIRVLAISAQALGTQSVCYVYFGTAADPFLGSPTKIISTFLLGSTNETFSVVFPKEQAPVGTADEVLSFVGGIGISDSGKVCVHYVEE